MKSSQSPGQLTPKTEQKPEPLAPTQTPALPGDPPSEGPPPTTVSPKPTKETIQHSQLTSEQIEEIIKLHEMRFGTRRIAEKLGLGRKVIRHVLGKLDLLRFPCSKHTSEAFPYVSKLDPFRDEIKEMVSKYLTNTRILRTIRALGYQGGMSILAEYTKTLRVQPPPKKKVWRRFETRPGEETQFDWSPYRVALGGVEKVVHAFAATLGFSRRTHARFYNDERESTLLEAHTLAFADFEGVTRRGVYDWMSTVVLGTVGKDRNPLWNLRFLEYTKHYGYEPYLCKVGDPDRKGKGEKFFQLLERDFLRGSVFDSLDDLNAKVSLWLDEVANRRVHGTTRKVPMEAWEEERPFLIALPESRYPTYDEEIRKVGPDSVLSVRGTSYTVPARLAHQNVSVHLFSNHFEVCDHKGEVAFFRRYAEGHEHGKLIIDSSHYESVRRRTPMPGGSVARLEEALLTRFPGLDELCAGLRLRMKAFAHVHLRALWRLADRYGDEAFAKAAARAQQYRRFDSHAVRRILEKEYPLPDEEPDAPLTAAARVIMALGEVDGGSLDDYAYLDSTDSKPAPTETETKDEDDNNNNDNDAGDEKNSGNNPHT